MKTKKRFFALALCSAFLILASVVGATAAWFTSSASVTGTAKTGTLSLTVTIGANEYTKASQNLTTAFKKDDIMPGDSVCDTIKVKVTTTDPNGAYVRVKFTISGAGNISPTLGSGWTKSGDYYYYGTSATTLTKMTAETTFCTAATLATSTTSQGNITVTLTVDAVQASNQGGTIAWN
ncbi:MAG: hypothetical protein ACLRFG_00900 [Clostridia bacterium]